ncbi:MAG: acetyltransferase [Bacteroidia bacterium]|nr:acetyltransferase [Bacteroidia bacterium]MCO5254576.1 acetyltransferase [Bacteroidota bacterium]
MKRLAIIGSGDLGQHIAHHAVQDGKHEVVGFFDDYEVKGTLKNQILILGAIAEVEDMFRKGDFDCLMIGIGYKHMQVRKELYEKLSGKIPFATLIHSSSYIDNSAEIGEGCFILPGCIVDKHVKIGANVLLNVGAVISHDTQVDNHCFLSPSVSIAGKTHIKECCIIGINSTIIDNITIEPFIQIAGGTVVIENLTISGMYAGVPAKLKKRF